MHFKTASLAQLILRGVANVANLAIFSLILYCTIEFNRLFGMTFATVIVAFVYNTILMVAYWKLFQGRPAPPSKAVNLDNLPRLAMSDLFIVILSSVSAGLMGARGRGRGPYIADPWRMIAFGLQIGTIVLQLIAGILACEGCTKESDKYVPVAQQAREG